MNVGKGRGRKWRTDWTGLAYLCSQSGIARSVAAGWPGLGAECDGGVIGLVEKGQIR